MACQTGFIDVGNGNCCADDGTGYCVKDAQWSGGIKDNKADKEKKTATNAANAQSWIDMFLKNVPGIVGAWKGNKMVGDTYVTQAAPPSQDDGKIPTWGIVLAVLVVIVLLVVLFKGNGNKSAAAAETTATPSVK